MSLILNSPNKRKWRRRGLILSLLIVLLPLLGLYLYGQLRTPGAMLTSENYMDRPIGSFWVNDFWGGNGGVTCCWRLDGPTAKVVWILSMSKTQEDQGMQIERHEIELPMPPRSRNDRYLHVRFDPGNQVRLGWSPDLFSPFSPRPDKAQNKEVDNE
ncbi:hypothetical protein N878_10940 [Pseudomonas sp. EGD-AK9]|uniref:DUF3304 domain-containing protein n=1 Tax=Pseudomonas sp. EGD-AK9 TaxID=1386078 RepID=UPI000396EE26|nr:DUF3304 domain-containing protein [Pseudomonas sp. EGD-AK9]ERI49687.1 hypothetical protein N878_10940 [Pseudomonas sp. EGD-AK9]